MEIIVSHNHLDFDGLAAMVAAKRLYPKAELVLVGTLSANVQQFMSLHKDSLPIRWAKEIPLAKVKRVIMVDTKNPRRLGPLQALVDEGKVEVHVFDHHPATGDDVSAVVCVAEQIGATTTLLVEKIRQQGLTVTAFEATILALGIYEDTGSLLFPSTTPRDVQAVAYLLEAGANLGVIASFMERPLSEEQKLLFNQLLNNARHQNINGVDVLLTTGLADEYVSGLDFLTHKLGEIEAYDVVFTVVAMDKRVYLVARSRLDSVLVNEICARFMGGGHEKAASATIKGRTLESVLDELQRVLREKIRPPLLARDIMSTPVKTVPMHLSIEEAGKIMLRYGHTGLPVVDGDRVVGVISRRDVDKAKLHGLGHAPVKAYMAKSVIAVGPETPVTEIQYLMIEHDIGRLPVIENGRIIGIVSRTDVLRTFHGKDLPEDHQLLYDGGDGLLNPTNVAHLMEECLPGDLHELLREVGRLADAQGCRVFVVGGFVRDLLLKVKNLDVDLVVEGDGPAFARFLAESLGGQVRVHKRFGTAQVSIPNGLKLDVATARVEYYEYPAALPTVESSSLRHDLYRRDFTINAMAIQLNEDKFGDLIDFFGGRRDLELGLIRILYNLSFVEDPTRIIRAIRFEQRYGFKIEPQTLELAKNAMANNFLRELSYERIRDELILILNELRPLRALRRLAELGVQRQILPEVEFGPDLWEMLARVPTELDRFKSLKPTAAVERWILYFLLIVHPVGLIGAEEIARRFRLEKRAVQALVAAFRVEHQLAQVSPLSVPMSTLYRWLHGLPPEVLVFLLVRAKTSVWRQVFTRYLYTERHCQPTINGHDLIQMGLKPGPAFRRILEAVRDARLDGRVTNREEELALINELLRQPEGSVVNAQSNS
ncbi:MAG: CBS domain-containing protein [Firmicutes bacterium]|nr:CBS domain-containing protein [Bacillota bacterium]